MNEWVDEIPWLDIWSHPQYSQCLPVQPFLSLLPSTQPTHWPSKLFTYPNTFSVPLLRLVPPPFCWNVRVRHHLMNEVLLHNQGNLSFCLNSHNIFLSQATHLILWTVFFLTPFLTLYCIISPMKTRPFTFFIFASSELSTDSRTMTHTHPHKVFIKFSKESLPGSI